MMGPHLQLPLTGRAKSLVKMGTESQREHMADGANVGTGKQLGNLGEGTQVSVLFWQLFYKLKFKISY